MSIEKEVDFIIVGQGLAGSSLALELIERGQQVYVFDEPDKNHSSAVAAGLFNPITGRVMTKTWKADLLFPFLMDFYAKAEKSLAARFFYPMPLYRPFISVQEQNEWMGKSAAPGMQSYLKQVLTQSQFGDHVYDNFGGLLLAQCGYVDTNAFIRSVRGNLISRNSYAHEKFIETELTLNDTYVGYKDMKAKKVIFCNGSEALKSHFFGWLPFRLLKGETIQVQLDQNFDCIYNRGVYVVPEGRTGLYKVGATYNTKDMSLSISSGGKAELISKLNELLKQPYEITTQNWGIRPSTADRKPFLGCHPKDKTIVVFNGLGTKGVSLAPYFANQLADWLIGKGEIDKEVDIRRFKYKN